MLVSSWRTWASQRVSPVPRPSSPPDGRGTISPPKITVQPLTSSDCKSVKKIKLIFIIWYPYKYLHICMHWTTDSTVLIINDFKSVIGMLKWITLSLGHVWDVNIYVWCMVHAMTSAMSVNAGQLYMCTKSDWCMLWEHSSLIELLVMWSSVLYVQKQSSFHGHAQRLHKL